MKIKRITAHVYDYIVATIFFLAIYNFFVVLPVSINLTTYIILASVITTIYIICYRYGEVKKDYRFKYMISSVSASLFIIIAILFLFLTL